LKGFVSRCILRTGDSGRLSNGVSPPPFRLRTALHRGLDGPPPMDPEPPSRLGEPDTNWNRTIHPCKRLGFFRDCARKKRFSSGKQPRAQHRILANAVLTNMLSFSTL
jgi:hypothetical protein